MAEGASPALSIGRSKRLEIAVLHLSRYDTTPSNQAVKALVIQAEAGDHG